MSEINRQLQEATAQLAQFSEEYRLFGQTSQATADAIQAGSSKNAARLTAAGTAAAAGLGQLASGATAFTRSLYQGEQGMKGVNGIMDGLGGAADQFGTALMTLGGPFGIAAGIILKLVSAATKAAKVVGENADKQFAAYQKLGQIGATAADGMRGTTEAAYKLGLNISNLDQFVSLVEKNSQSLALFAGSAAAGRDALADLGDSLKGERQNFRMIGIDLENQNQALAGFINLQVQTGQKDRMSREEMTEAARAYVYEQDIITRLTGQTREATEAARKEALKEERFLAAVKLAEREKAGEGARLTKLNDLIQANFDPVFSKGMRDLISGFGVSEEASKVLLSGNSDAVKLLEQYKQGSITEFQLVERLQNNLKDFSETHGIAISIMGEGGKTTLSAAAQSQNEARTKTSLTEQQAKAEKDQADAKSGLLNQATKNQAELELKSREAKEKMDRALDNFMEPLGRALNGMLAVVDDLVDGIKGLVGWFLGKEPDQRRATQETVAAAQAKYNDALKKYDEQKALADADTNEANREANTQLLATLKQQVDASRQAVDSEKQLMEQGTAEERRARRRAQREQGAAYPEQTAGGGAGGTGQAQPAAKSGQMATSASEQATKMIAQFENFTPKAHWDFKQYSIGYGTKTTDPDEISGRKTITPAEGQARLSSTIGQIVPKVVAAGQAKQWGQNQVDAMVSFAYNLGVGAIKSVTDNGRRTNQQTADAMLQYNKAGGRVQTGLARRREAERAVFVTDMPMLADGGIANQPSIAGEAGPEAVIPIVNGRVPVDLSAYAQQLSALRPPQDETVSTAESPDQAGNVDFDQVITSAVDEIMQTNSVETEMLDLLQAISRANRSTTDNNRKFYRARAS